MTATQPTTPEGPTDKPCPTCGATGDEECRSITGCVTPTTLAPSGVREGDGRWVAKHTDQHVVRREPWDGRNFVVQSWEAAEALADLLNASQPATPVREDEGLAGEGKQ